MKLKSYLLNLKEIEEQIEEVYLKLSELETRDLQLTNDYEYYFQELINLMGREKQILVNMGSEYSNSEIKKVVLKNKYSKKELLISLGYLTDAYNYRILHMLDDMSGDDYLDYASVLRTDISNIILKFLDYLINNPYYKDIKQSLVLYKYNLIFMNAQVEDDFIMGNLNSSLSLKTDSYRTGDLPAYSYIDKSILVLESIDDMYSITEENELGSSDAVARVLIYIINIFARLTLCEVDTLSLIYDDVMSIMESDMTSIEVKKLFSDMSLVLENIKNQIAWAR